MLARQTDIDIPDKASDAKGLDAPFEVVNVVNKADLERSEPFPEEYTTEARAAHPKPCERAEEYARLGLDKQLIRFLIQFRR